MRCLLKAAALAVLPAVWVAFPVSAETDTLVILHTNDLHGHIRPDYDGNGEAILSGEDGYPIP